MPEVYERYNEPVFKGKDPVHPKFKDNRRGDVISEANRIIYDLEGVVYHEHPNWSEEEIATEAFRRYREML